METGIDIEQVLKKIDKLPTIPVVAAKIFEAIKDENKNLDDLAQRIVERVNADVAATYDLVVGAFFTEIALV